ncbi:MATE family efflux transporter [Saccharomonospora glauca]|uniref:Glycosyltransferase RgtA/B/C/D-like domain-containing protein n=1 Tax=Saccharomonospora glauca K62 TaxID=928724 RepID=I1CWU0_9PSEU|nr:hypothetical protein [Saccharomonospora glauca]EIE97164.1 hypothetical protein SacglDRAFT_00201 [Saccharomonospora glauca K62]
MTSETDRETTERPAGGDATADGVRAEPSPGSASPASRPSSSKRSDRGTWLVGALALLVGCVFVAVDLAFNQGKLIAPIDDAYIHLQYASQLGSGHPFEYNTGDPVSTGASSLLYAFVLAAAHAVGFTGTALLAFAVAFGVVCFALTTVLVAKLGTALVGRAVGLWAGVLTAVSGPLLWGAASGMEVGLTSVLATGAVLAFVRERDAARFRLTPALAALLALVRPEGLFFAVALCAAMVWTSLRAHGPRLGRLVACCAPLLVGAAQYAFYRIATGTFSANGVQSKSHLYDRPIFYFGEFVDRTFANVRVVVDHFNGLNNTDFAFPFALVFFLVGIGYLLVTRPEWRPLGTAMVAGFALVVLSASTLSTALVHELRYFQPFLPLFFVFAAIGGYALTRLVPRERERRFTLYAVLLVMVLFTVVATPTWAVRLGRQAATIRDTDVSVGAWISGNLPPDAVVGVKDVGAIAYFGERRVVDTIGLATNGFAEASNNGPGSLYEKLRSLPPEQRPTHFAVYEPWPGASMQSFVDTGVFASPPLITFPVRTPPDLNNRRIVPFTETSVYRADWTLAGSGDRAPVSGRVRDYLNVGSLESEQRHDYEVRAQQPGWQPYTVLRRQGDVIDSGRTVVGGESFTVTGLTPGQPLRIATRVLSAAANPENREVKVRVDGRDAGVWRLPDSPEAWMTTEFTVAGDLITSPEVTVELGPVRPLLSPYPEYTSFGYWFVQ